MYYLPDVPSLEASDVCVPHQTPKSKLWLLGSNASNKPQRDVTRHDYHGLKERKKTGMASVSDAASSNTKSWVFKCCTAVAVEGARGAGKYGEAFGVV